eukprot:PhF_6_TR37570/c0_g2_i10/m.55690
MEPCNRSSTSLLLHPTRMILRGLRLLFYGDSHLRDVALSLILMLGYPESRIPHKHYSWSAVFAQHDLMITIVFELCSTARCARRHVRCSLCFDGGVDSDKVRHWLEIHHKEPYPRS